MTASGQLSPIGRLTLWVLGGALFLDIAVVPYWFYMDFEFTGSVPIRVGVSAAIILVLLWLATAFGPLKTNQ